MENRSSSIWLLVWNNLLIFQPVIGSSVPINEGGDETWQRYLNWRRIAQGARWYTCSILSLYIIPPIKYLHQICNYLLEILKIIFCKEIAFHWLIFIELKFPYKPKLSLFKPVYLKILNLFMQLFKL